MERLLGWGFFFVGVFLCVLLVAGGVVFFFLGFCLFVPTGCPESYHLLFLGIKFSSQ